MWLDILKTRFSLCFFKLRGKQGCLFMEPSMEPEDMSFLLSHSINKLDDCQG